MINKYNVYLDKNAFAASLLLKAFDDYGMELFEIDPELLKDDIQSKHKGMSNANVDRLLAAIDLHVTDSFYTDPITFGVSCRVFNRASYLMTEAPTLADVCWGLSEARLILDSGNDKQDTVDSPTPAIEQYIQLLMSRAGIITPIQALGDIKPPTKIESNIDDPLLAVESYQESLNQAEAYDSTVEDKLTECLGQISRLNIPMSTEAQEQLAQVLRGD